MGTIELNRFNLCSIAHLKWQPLLGWVCLMASGTRCCAIQADFHGMMSPAPVVPGGRGAMPYDSERRRHREGGWLCSRFRST